MNSQFVQWALQSLLIAAAVCGCSRCQDNISISNAKGIEMVEITVAPWHRNPPRERFILSNKEHSDLLAYFSTCTRRNSQKFLALADIVIRYRSGKKVTIAVYSNGDNAKAVIEFNGNKCYYEIGDAKALHKFLTSVASKK